MRTAFTGNVAEEEVFNVVIVNHCFVLVFYFKVSVEAPVSF